MTSLETDACLGASNKRVSPTDFLPNECNNRFYERFIGMNYCGCRLLGVLFKVLHCTT